MTTMFASLVRAMAAVAARIGLRRRKRSKTVQMAVSLPAKQDLQCPVCGDQHAGGLRQLPES